VKIGGSKLIIQESHAFEVRGWRRPWIL